MRKNHGSLAKSIGSFVIFLLQIGIVAITAAHPQLSSNAPKPTFDVVSIKPSPPGTRQRLAIEPGGRFIAEGVQLNLLVALAYHLQANYQLSGPQPWMATDSWTIEAKADGITEIPHWTPPFIPDVIAVRLQSLLADRFALKTHFETRDMQIYSLVLDKSPAKLKPVEAPSDNAPAAPVGAQSASAPGSTSSATPAPPPGAVLAGPGRIIASAITMSQLVALLNRLMDRPVIDHTNLQAHYNVSLQFDPASSPHWFGPPPTNGAAATQSAPSEDPSIFVALQQQLGLKLEAAKEPVQVLVIDSAQRPTPN